MRFPNPPRSHIELVGKGGITLWEAGKGDFKDPSKQIGG